jgi:hypothetical protein
MSHTYGGGDPGHSHAPGERIERISTASGGTTDTAAYAPVETDATLRKDRVRWGPIFAGLLTTIATLVVLTVLGLAIGMTALDPGETGQFDLGTAAAIWGAVSALVAFFLGGWVASRTAAVDGAASGTTNGIMVGVAAIALLIWMVGAGLGNLLGVMGANLNQMADIARTVDPATAEEALPTAQAAYENTRDTAWGTFIGLVLALAAAALGGYLGHNHGAEVVRTRTNVPARGPRARA